MLKDIPIIKCPICGEELLPAEVYIPKEFFGNPGEVFRDTAGKIDFYTGSDMCLYEEYICNGCNNKLKITANITFNVEANKVDSIEEEYITEFVKPKRIKLIEEDLF